MDYKLISTKKGGIRVMRQDQRCKGADCIFTQLNKMATEGGIVIKLLAW